jgi:hypothetical protein
VAMSRFTAFFYHIAISLVIFVILAYLIVEIWYPEFFFAIDGGWEGIRLVIGVDLVLGPLLTLVVFKSGKPGLKFDLGCIGALQTLCLIAGVFVIYTERPVYFIFYDKHFYSASADTYRNYGVEPPSLTENSQTFPIKVISKLPDHPIEKAGFLTIIFQDNIPAWIYRPTYLDLSDHMDEVIVSGTSEVEMRGRDKKGNLDRWLAKHGGEFDEYAFIPVHSRYRDAFIGISKAKKLFVDIIEIPPPT